MALGAWVPVEAHLFILQPPAPPSQLTPLDPASAGLSSPTGSPMRNLIQTQFGTCLHIDCVVIKWLHLWEGRATCISQPPSHGLGLATAPASDVQTGVQGGRPLAVSRELGACLFKMGTFIFGGDEMTWEGACTKPTSQMKQQS